MSDITWVIVADDGRARVFQTQGLALDLQEIEDLVNTEGHGTGLTDKEAVIELRITSLARLAALRTRWVL